MAVTCFFFSWNAVVGVLAPFDSENKNHEAKIRASKIVGIFAVFFLGGG